MLASLALLGLSAYKTLSRFREQRSVASAAELQANHEAILFGENAGRATRQSVDALRRGEEAASGVMRDARVLQGEQRAVLAAQGVDVNQGSAADVQTSDAALADVDMARIRENARREAEAYTTEAGFYQQQGRWARLAGQNAAKSYRNQAAGTLLEGVGDLADIWSAAPKGISRSPVRPLDDLDFLAGGPIPKASNVSDYRPAPPRVRGPRAPALPRGGY